jgi:hypothetical protein
MITKRKIDSLNNLKIKQTFWWAVGLHFLLATILYLILYFVGEIKVLPNAENILAWDATNYYTIQHQGYFDFQLPTSNIPFFPLIGLIWRWLSLSPMAAALLNVSFFLSGLHLLNKQYQFSFQTLLLFLSIPSIFFLCVPYAEALFFFSTTFVILGLAKKKKWWVVVGLFIAGMTRPSAIFFFPAIIFMELIGLKKWRWSFIKNALERIVLYFSATLGGLFIVFYIQYEATGDWLAFFHQRDKNGIQLPSFPLTTWRGAKLLWLDGVAFAIAFASFIYCGILFFRRVFDLKIQIAIPPRPILFSLAFLTMTMIHVLFFNDKDLESGTSSLFGLNRFLFATSFFLMVFAYFKNRVDFAQKRFQQLFVLFIFLVFAMIGIFHPSNQPEYLRPLIYLLFIAGFLFFQKRFTKYWMLVYGVHMVCQVLLFDKFLRGIWVG